MAIERTATMRQLDELDRRLGKGETLSMSERAAVLKDGVPAWLFVGQRLGAPALAERCTRAIAALGDLRRQVAPLVGDTEHAGG